MEFQPFPGYSLVERLKNNYPPQSEYDTESGIELDNAVETKGDIEYQDYPDELEPQPVTIVDKHEGPHVSHVYLQSYTLANNTTVQILGNRYEKRTVKLYNTGVNEIKISTHQNGNEANSFYLNPDLTLELTTTDELWASSSDSRLSTVVEIVDM